METYKKSIWWDAWTRLKKNNTAMLGLYLVIILLITGTFAPWLAPMDPYTQILEYHRKPPGFKGNILLFQDRNLNANSIIPIESFELIGDSIYYVDLLDRHYTAPVEALTGDIEEEWHQKPLYLLGTDNFGRDIFSRIIHGTRISLKIGFLASTLSLLVGVLLGLLSGYYGGWIDTLVMRFTDIMFGFPALLFLIGITAAFEPSLTVVFFAIGFVSWPSMARVVRGQVLGVKEQEYVLAAKVLGLPDWILITRHILPNCLAPIIVAYTMGIASAIMAEASLSFIGLGAQPPTPSWGAMINYGKDFLRVAPWMSLIPGVAIALTVLGFNLLGDGLRDALDPKMKPEF